MAAVMSGRGENDYDDEDVLYEQGSGRQDQRTLLGSGIKTTPYSEEKTPHRCVKTCILCAGFLGMGLCVAILGTTLLDLSNGGSLTTMSYAVTSRSVGILVGSIAAGFCFDRFDQHLLLALSLFGLSMFSVIVPWCSSMTVLFTVIALWGVTIGFFNTGGNIVCVNIWGRKTGPFIQALHFSFGLGAFIAPLIAEPFLVSYSFPGNATAVNASTMQHLRNIPVPCVQTKHNRDVEFFPNVVDFHDTNDVQLEEWDLIGGKLKGISYIEGKFSSLSRSRRRNGDGKDTDGSPDTDNDHVLNDPDLNGAGNSDGGDGDGNADDENGDLGDGDSDLGDGDGDLGNGDGNLGNGDGDLGNGDGDLGNGDGDLGNGDGDLGNGDGDLGNGDGDSKDGDGDLDDGDDDNKGNADDNHVDADDETSTEGGTEVFNNNTESASASDSMINRVWKLIPHPSQIQKAYMIIAMYNVLVSLPFVWFFCSGPRLLLARNRAAVSSGADSQTSSDSKLFRFILLTGLFLFFFLYKGIEESYGAYIYTFAKCIQLKFSSQQASYLNATFWGTFALGRFLSICVASVLSPKLMLIPNILGVIISLVLLATLGDSHSSILWAASVSLGLCMASIFPAGIAWAERYILLTGKAMSSFFIASSIAGILIPWLLGFLFSVKGVTVLMKLLMGLAIVLFLVFVLLQILASRHGERSASSLPDSGAKQLLSALEEEVIELENIAASNGRGKSKGKRSGDKHRLSQTIREIKKDSKND